LVLEVSAELCPSSRGLWGGDALLLSTRAPTCRKLRPQPRVCTGNAPMTPPVKPGPSRLHVADFWRRSSALRCACDAMLAREYFLPPALRAGLGGAPSSLALPVTLVRGLRAPNASATKPHNTACVRHGTKTVSVQPKALVYPTTRNSLPHRRSSQPLDMTSEATAC
jgi:hypothetical protein